MEACFVQESVGVYPSFFSFLSFYRVLETLSGVLWWFVFFPKHFSKDGRLTPSQHPQRHSVYGFSFMVSKWWAG